MAKFSVIAKNEMIEQINNIDDCQYAFEMYRYLTVEAGFPDVKIVDCETGVVLMYFKKETTTYEYVDPDIMASIAEAPIEPNGIDEETADSNRVEEEITLECREIIESLFLKAESEMSEILKTNLEDIYNKLIACQYDYGTLKFLKKTLKEISKNY